MPFYLLLGITYGFAAGVQPGPLQSFLISRTLSSHWRYTLPAAFAPVLTDIPVVLLVLLLLNNLPDWFVQCLHLAGGLFILFLAYGAFRSYKNYRYNQELVPQSRQNNFFQAVVVNLLNPNPYLSWSLVLGPLLLQGWGESPGNGVALIGGFYFVMIMITILIIIIFATLRRLGPQVNRILIGVSSLALAFFGIYQLWLGITTLWFK